MIRKIYAETKDIKLSENKASVNFTKQFPGHKKMDFRNSLSVLTGFEPER